MNCWVYFIINKEQCHVHNLARPEGILKVELLRNKIDDFGILPFVNIQ